MSSRWRRPASTAGAVAAALRVRRPIDGLVRANYPPWPGGNLAHHPYTDNTLIIADMHRIIKGFCRLFSENFRRFLILQFANLPFFAVLQSSYLYTPSCVSLFRSSKPLSPNRFYLFAFMNLQIVDIPAVACKILNTLPRVSMLCRLFANKKASGAFAECPLAL